MKVWDAETGQEVLPFKGPMGGYVALSPDGKHIVYGEGGRNGKGLGCGDGPGVAHPQGAHGRCQQRGVSPDGKRILSGAGTER